MTTSEDEQRKMRPPAIKVTNLAKRYFINSGGNTDALSTLIEMRLRQALKRFLVAPKNILKPAQTERDAAPAEGRAMEFWALKGVSFEVQPGEVLGILGPNGAGKSTLLKILSEITQPTKGRIELRGKIGSLLEVGTGFNPELSGHENIYLYGAILGMDREQVARKYDEIVKFSEIGKFLHHPIKHYSSGMHAKLGFSVASHLDCEILLVDEILSVGDASFRRKSYEKMSSLIMEGRTVIFVSHNMSAINNLCTRALVLNNGEIVFEGDTSTAINYYLESFGHKNKDSASNPACFPENLDKPLNILKITTRNSADEITSRIRYLEEFSIEMEILIREENPDYFVGVGIRSSDGQLILMTCDDDLGPAIAGRLKPGRYTTRVRFPARLFRPDTYRLMCALAKKPTGQIDRQDDAVELEIVDHDTWRAQNDLYRKTAAIAPELSWKIEPTEKELTHDQA